MCNQQILLDRSWLVMAPPLNLCNNPFSIRLLRSTFWTWVLDVNLNYIPLTRNLIFQNYFDKRIKCSHVFVVILFELFLLDSADFIIAKASTKCYHCSEPDMDCVAFNWILWIVALTKFLWLYKALAVMVTYNRWWCTTFFYPHLF